jgi:hypothetical protein
MLLLPFVNGDLLSKSDIFQHDRVLSFSEQPNQSINRNIPSKRASMSPDCPG